MKSFLRRQQPHRSKRIFDGVGAAVILVWLFLLATLVYREEIGSSAAPSREPGLRAVSRDLEKQDWMEIHLQGRKVGYAHTSVQPLDGGFLVQEEVFLRLNLLGRENGIFTTTRSVTDLGFGLESFAFEMRSGVVSFKIRGRAENGRLAVTTGEGRSARSDTVPLSGKPVLGSGMVQSLRGRRPNVGEAFPFSFFDPSTLTQKSLVMKAVAEEEVSFEGGTVNALRLETDFWGRPLVIWLDDEGEVLKEEGFLGFTLLRSTADRARAGISGGGDLYAMAAVPVKQALSAQRQLKRLRLRINGLDRAEFDPRHLNEGRQRWVDGVVTIEKEDVPGRGRRLSAAEIQERGLEGWLRPEPGIESDADEIVRTAHALSGNEDDPVILARRLLSWVYQRLEKRPVVSFPSALEVLKHRAGDCNEHTALLTALLRARGIPARVCVGLVYMEGAFYYHAWTEAYLAEAWVSMDATMEQMPADATHLKLVEGGLDRQAGLIGLMGVLQIDIAGHDYD